MMDIMNFKFKKYVAKKLPQHTLKEVKIKKGLPTNNKLMNVFNIAKGMPNAQHKTFNRTIFKTHTRYAPMQKRMPILNTYKRKPKFDANGRIPYNEVRSFMVNAGNIGITRFKQQKGLKPWGDKDGDGLINMLDCNPLNKKQQGPDLESMIDGDVEEEIKEEPKEEDMEVTLDVPDEEPAEKPQPKAVDKLKSFLGGLQKATERDKEIATERKQREADLRAKAVKEAEKRAEKKRIAAEVRKMETEKQQRTTRAERFGNALKAYPGAISTLGGAARGVGGFGVSPTGYTSSSAHLMAFMGKPVEQPQQAPIQQAQANPQQGVISPYSKRRVSYVRGPYRKSQ
jgi:hypothetical protein